jgi:hypothetical protein
MDSHSQQNLGGSNFAAPTNNDSFTALELDKTLEDLKSLTLRLRMMAFYIATFTALNLTILIFSLPFVNVFFLKIRSLPFIGAGCAIAALLCAVVHEISRKQGDVLFEEISDEVQWRVRSQGHEKIAPERPLLDVRVTLRSFAHASDLPFIPSRFGAAIYVAINILILLSVSWFARG